ncbi:hypothetical protein D9619_009027 [Psilocybe cf. subviscida]|uniref:NACHT domain-containing protein n=1 Tax=Psilocybe cf. subviscida TaxID=2480587 RepID=A0A8H5BTZ7_9AGAR|nr:hypothetical protein D9619_009027 [Psilocybe cf. subviscida]
MSSATSEGPDSSGSLFQNAKAIHISGGSFYAYGGRETPVDAALSILSSRVEHGAAHDAAAREDVRKCHENTRVALIGGIEAWATCHEDHHVHPLLWMYGPAGSGKTTIMQTMAATFAKEGTLAASFFFSRSAPNRPKTKVNFVTTIAHQLWFNIPAIRDHLVEALADSSLVDKGLVHQLDVLIINPLNKLKPSQMGDCRIFMVDGLDECEGDSSQRDVLDLLAHFTRQTLHSFPVLVASRQTSAIQAFFSNTDITRKTRGVPLDNDYKADEDIRKVVVAAFDNIKLEHPSKDGLGSEWPNPSVIDTIVKRSSGQFIYASVVMKYIAEHSRHPKTSLKTILNVQASGGDPRPYKELDAIYTQIMSSVEPENLLFVMDVMGCLLLAQGSGTSIFVDVALSDRRTSLGWDTVFTAEPGTTQARLNRLRPLITLVPSGHGKNITFRFSHASFADYLLDMSRSGEFFLDMRMVHCRLACYWLKAYTAHLENYDGCASSPGQRHDCAVKSTRLFHAYNNTGSDFDSFIWHCLEANITTELLNDISLFDIEAVLSWMAVHIESYRPNFWKEVLLWVNLAVWLQEQAPPAHQDLINTFSNNIQRAIYTVVSQRSASSETMSEFAIFVSLWPQICLEDKIRNENYVNERDFKPITNIWGDASIAIGVNYSCRHKRSEFCWRCICHASSAFLSEALAPTLAMNGRFFREGIHYSNMALRLFKDYTTTPGRRGLLLAIAHFLSKASPDENLGILIRDNLLQIPRKYDRVYIGDKQPIQSETAKSRKEAFMAFCIYIYHVAPYTRNVVYPLYQPTDIQKDSIMTNGHAQFASSLMRMALNLLTVSFHLNLAKGNRDQPWLLTQL